MWLGPPCMNSQMTRLARGAKCGCRGASGSVAPGQAARASCCIRPAKAKPPIPPPAFSKNCRRSCRCASRPRPARARAPRWRRRAGAARWPCARRGWMQVWRQRHCSYNLVTDSRVSGTGFAAAVGSAKASFARALRSGFVTPSSVSVSGTPRAARIDMICAINAS